MKVGNQTATQRFAVVFPVVLVPFKMHESFGLTVPTTIRNHGYYRTRHVDFAKTTYPDKLYALTTAMDAKAFRHTHTSTYFNCYTK